MSETAAAFAAGQPIVISKTTPISMLGGMDNPMISGLALNWSKVSDVAAIPNAVINAAQAMNGIGGPPVVFGKQVQAVVNAAFPGAPPLPLPR